MRDAARVQSSRSRRVVDARVEALAATRARRLRMSDSKPMRRPRQPLRAARSSSSSSQAIVVVARPPHRTLQRDQRAEQLLRVVDVGDEIEVEEDQLARAASGGCPRRRRRPASGTAAPRRRARRRTRTCGCSRASPRIRVRYVTSALLEAARGAETAGSSSVRSGLWS